MSEDTPKRASASGSVEPVASETAETPTIASETEPDVENERADAVVAPETSETVLPPAPGETQPLAADDLPEPTRPQVVYVHAPTPPTIRHNRLFAALIELVSTVVFAFAYAGSVAAFIAITPNARFEPSFSGFLNSAALWVPVLFYAIAAVILGLLLNRAAWWVHVLATLAVAAFVFWASVGVLTLTQNVVAMTPDEASAVFWATALNPIMFFAAIMAREVSMWFGLVIATRGRRVAAANSEARATYAKEQAEKKAEYERAAATV